MQYQVFTSLPFYHVNVTLFVGIFIVLVVCARYWMNCLNGKMLNELVIGLSRWEFLLDHCLSPFLGTYSDMYFVSK